MWTFLHKTHRLLQFLWLAIERRDLFWSVLLDIFVDRTRVGELLRLHRAPWLADLGIDTVLDVGAYTGGFAYAAGKVFPGAQVVAFEPVPEHFARVARLAESEGFSAHNIALGSENGEIVFYQNEFGPSSSALPISEAHTEAFPETAATRQIRVQSRRLDDVAAEMELGERILLKSDVQGFDLEVLKGATRTLANTQVVIIEASLQPLYEQQADFAAIYALLTAQGFRFLGDMGTLTDPRDQQPLQVDALFVRKEAA